MRYAALVLLTVAMVAQAATAFLVSSHMGQSVTGQSAIICVYSYNGQQFSRAYPLGNMCPMSVEVQ